MAANCAPEYDYMFKLLLIGDSGVGKSNMLLRFADDVYKEEYAATIGVDFKICSHQIDGKVVKSQIWDTAGQERFRVITSSYYRGSHGVMVVYDVSDRQSFKHIRMWMQEIEKYAAEGETCSVVVGNKCDLPSSKRVVTEDEGRELADELKVPFMETSARHAHNIQHTFDLLCREIMTKLERSVPAQPVDHTCPRTVDLRPNITRISDAVIVNCCR